MISDGRFIPTTEITASAHAILDDLDSLVRLWLFNEGRPTLG